MGRAGVFFKRKWEFSVLLALEIFLEKLPLPIFHPHLISSLFQTGFFKDLTDSVLISALILKNPNTYHVAWT